MESQSIFCLCVLHHCPHCSHYSRRASGIHFETVVKGTLSLQQIESNYVGELLFSDNNVQPADEVICFNDGFDPR